MKHKIYLVCGALLCGSAEGAMTPAGRALVPQDQPVNQVSHNPAMLDALIKGRDSKKVNHVLSPKPQQLNVTRSVSENLTMIAERAYQARQCAVKKLSNDIYARNDDAIDFQAQLGWYFFSGFDYSPIQSALRAFGIETYGCNVDGAIRGLNEVSRDIEVMKSAFGGANESVVIDELRQHNGLVDGWLKILHGNLGVHSFSNGNKVVGSTLDAMIYKEGMYPALSKSLRLYLEEEDKQQNIGSALLRKNDKRMFVAIYTLNAIAYSKYSMQELNAVGNSKAFEEAKGHGFNIAQRLKHYKIRALYSGADQAAWEQAIKLLNTLYDPKWMHDLDRYTNDTDKFAHIDELRKQRGRGSLDESLSMVENGMKGASFVGMDYNSLMGSTIDEVMYRTYFDFNSRYHLSPFWKSYLIFKDKQKFFQQYPKLRDWQFDRDILLGALFGSRGNKQELIEFENSLAWKNYLEKYGKEVGEPNDLGIILQEYKDKAQ